MSSTFPGVDPAISTLLEATSSLVSSPELSEVLGKILKLAELLLEADAYAVWQCKVTDTQWRILYSAGLSEAYTSQKIEADITALRGREPLIAEIAEKHPQVSDRSSLYQREGVRSFIAYPLFTSDGGVGTVTFYFRKRKQMDDAFVQTGQLLANISNGAINAAEIYEAQKSMRREAQRAAERAEFLASASSLLSSSLDYNATLNRLAQLAVPKIADWCSVYVIDGNRLERVAVAHSDPAKIEMARELSKKFPPDLSQPRGIGEVIRGGKPQLIPELTEEMLRRGSYNEEHFGMLARLGMKSVLVVPLISRGAGLGAIALINAESRRVFTNQDLEIAESLATRAAVAIDNARLYDAMSKAKAEAQLREEELRLVQESAKVASWSFDLESQMFSFSSDNAGRLLGRGAGIHAMSFDEFRSLLFFSTDQHRFKEAFASLEKGRKDLEIEIRVRNQHGSANLLALRGKLFFNFGQSRMLGVLIDLTGSRQETPAKRNSGRTRANRRA